jgi:hypothetical protein
LRLVQPAVVVFLANLLVLAAWTQEDVQVALIDKYTVRQPLRAEWYN